MEGQFFVVVVRLINILKTLTALNCGTEAHKRSYGTPILRSHSLGLLSKYCHYDGRTGLKRGVFTATILMLWHELLVINSDYFWAT